MKIPFGKYKGLPMEQLPHDYLEWLVKNIDASDVKEEAKRILGSADAKQEKRVKSLEEQANEILGEEPIKLLRRGRGRPRKR